MAINAPQTVIEFGIVVFFIFVLFIIVTSRVKNFRNAFYTMFVATGVADTTSLAVNCLIRLNSELGLGKEFSTYMYVLIMVSGTTFVAHMIGNLLTTVNRYSAICLMQQYNKIWTRRNQWIAVVTQYVVAFLVYCHTIRTKMVYVQNSDGSWVYGGLEKEIDQVNRGIYIGVCLTYATASACLNVRLLVEWRKLTKTDGGMKHRRHEKGLLLNTLSVFVFTMLLCIQQIIRGIAVLTNNSVLNSMAKVHYYWINDAMIVISPLSLLLFSSDLRHDIANFFRCTRSKVDYTANNSTVTKVTPMKRETTIKMDSITRSTPSPVLVNSISSSQRKY